MLRTGEIAFPSKEHTNWLSNIQMVSPENTHTYKWHYTNWEVCIYLSTHICINIHIHMCICVYVICKSQQFMKKSYELKRNKEGYTSGFTGMTGKEEMM